MAEHGISTFNKEDRAYNFDINARPSDEAWTTLMRETSIGNLTFPQAYFAQGIRLAHSMMQQSEKERLPVFTFIRNKPDAVIVTENLKKSKEKAHAAYNIVTRAVADDQDQLGIVWENDMGNAKGFLTNVSRVIYEARHGDTPRPEDYDVIKAVQMDPMLGTLISYAYKGLLLDDVKDISRRYKSTITDFMKEYAQYTSEERPDGYDDHKKELHNTLVTTVNTVAKRIKASMVEQVRINHPGDSNLIAVLENKNYEKIFGDLGVAPIDPLRKTNSN